MARAGVELLGNYLEVKESQRGKGEPSSCEILSAKLWGGGKKFPRGALEGESQKPLPV